MKAYITRSLICLILVSVWQLIPVSHQSPLAIARDFSSALVLDDLKGTVWVESSKEPDCGKCTLEISFLASGKLLYEDVCEECACDGCPESDGKWTQTGNSFTARVVETGMEDDKHTLQLDGTIQGDRLVFTEKELIKGKFEKPIQHTALRKR